MFSLFFKSLWGGLALRSKKQEVGNPLWLPKYLKQKAHPNQCAFLFPPVFLIHQAYEPSFISPIGLIRPMFHYAGTDPSDPSDLSDLSDLLGGWKPPGH